MSGKTTYGCLSNDKIRCVGNVLVSLVEALAMMVFVGENTIRYAPTDSWLIFKHDFFPD